MIRSFMTWAHTISFIYPFCISAFIFGLFGFVIWQTLYAKLSKEYMEDSPRFWATFWTLIIAVFGSFVMAIMFYLLPFVVCLLLGGLVYIIIVAPLAGKFLHNGTLAAMNIYDHFKKK